jgi:FkbM family methyltransferase
MMRKIVNLYRLNFRNLVKMPVYLVKRVFGVTPDVGEKILNEYYHQLILSDGFLKAEDSSYFASFFPEWNAQIKTRKRPSSDLFVFRQVFYDMEYKPLVKTFSDYFDANATLDIIDAGSNIGLTSLYLSRHFPNARFICIEPDGGNFETLEFNLLENGVKNSERIKAGLWSRNTRLELVNDFRDMNDWSIRVRETGNDTGLESFSIQHLIEQYGLEKIDILKMDIEGSEKEIFGPRADTSFLEITKCIAIEIHDEFDCREAIYNELEKYGFTYFNSGELTIGINQKLV